MIEYTPENNKMDGSSESLGRQETIQSVLDSLSEKQKLSRQAHILRNLLRWKPWLASVRCWGSVTQAESNAEVGVTEPLRIPYFDNTGGDFRFAESVIDDLEEGGADWSIAFELHNGERCVSIWRKPGEGYRHEM